MVPVLTALAAMAALFAQFRIEIERDADTPPSLPKTGRDHRHPD
jgi:hypothetical protein